MKQVYFLFLILIYSLQTIGQAVQFSYDGAGNRIKRQSGTTGCSSPRNPENPTGPLAGLDYRYFETAAGGDWCATSSLNGQTAVKTGNVTNFSLTPRNRDEYFGFEYTGFLDVPTEGEYTFYLKSDDAAVFMIGTNTVVSFEGCHGMDPEQSGTICLKAGRHALKTLFSQGGGGYGMELHWAGPGISKQLIPDNRLFRANCTAPSPPTVSPGSGTVCASSNQSLTLTASGCSGTKTWYRNGTQVSSGTGNTYAATEPGTYTVTCTVSGCTSSPSSGVSVTQAAGCGSSVTAGLSIWRAGAPGTRQKIQDLTNNIQIPQSSLGGNPSNWFITIDGQVSNASNPKYYDRVEMHMDGPGISNYGWGPENVAGSDGGPFGLYGRDGGITAPTGNYQLRAKVYNGSTVLVDQTINFSIVSCTAPSPPTLSASPASINQGNSTTLTAAGCSGGTITWSHGLGTGSSKTVTPTTTTTYTATCSIGGCTSSSGSVTVTVIPPSNPISITFSAWKAGTIGVRSKVMDLTDNVSIPISSFSGSQANWFIAINNGQVTNASGSNYYDRVEFRLDRPGATNEGWNENVAGSDGGPFGLHGRDGGEAPAGGSHQLRGFVWKGSTLVASRTLNFTINSSARTGYMEASESSVAAHETGHGLTVSPNPSSGSFEAAFLTYDDAPGLLSVIDVNGKTWFEKQVNAPGPHQVAVQLPPHASGVFIVLLRTQTGVQSKKVIVVK